MRSKTFVLSVALAATMIGLPACGDDTASDTDDTTTTTAAAKPTIDAVWARNSPMEATNGAAYMEVTGGTSDDEIVAVSVDPSVAGKVELHETVEATEGSGSDGMSTTTEGMAPTTAGGDGAMSSTTLSPAMEMRPVESIAVPAGETVSLKPGGYHVMLLELVKPLVIGESFDLTVTFAEAGEQTVQAEVKEAP